MIKLEKTETYGWEAAIRGMRNPLNSWKNGDSRSCASTAAMVEGWFEVGENDLTLMKKLAAAGNDHSKFLRMITVTVDVTAPLYWWKEFDTYKVGTVANSCSTMHKLTDKEFTLDDFSTEHLLPNPSRQAFECIIEALNTARNIYLECNDPIIKKDWWWQLIQLLPSSYNQKRTVQLNYAVLKNMYNARKAHKLDEWRELCKWVEQLPYSELITEYKERE